VSSKEKMHRFHVTMPWELVKALRHTAVDEGRSVSEIMTELAVKRLGMNKLKREVKTGAEEEKRRDQEAKQSTDS